MKTGLVGYTGFVGSNLKESYSYDHLYNSKNISQSFNESFDLLIYAGVRAEKFLAKKQPDYDLQLINEAIDNISKIKTKKLVLISTIDVYNDPQNVDEETIINSENLHPYGKHRLILEKWVQDNINNYFIVRLPALYGKNIKKNFIFDMMQIIPSLLNDQKIKQLQDQNTDLNFFSYYKLNNNGFYEIDNHLKDFSKLREFFKNNDFNALSFTDSRNCYQFFPLNKLWEYIESAIKVNIPLINLTSEPVGASELFKFIFDKPFTNEFLDNPLSYDLRSKYANLFNGKNGYYFDKGFLLRDIKLFVNSIK